jgi:hypothetical protein
MPRKPKDPPHFQVCKHTFKDPDFKRLSKVSQLLFVHLCYLRNCHGDKTNSHSFYRSDLNLIADTGYSRNTLKDCIAELISAGFITTECKLSGRKRESITYHLMDRIKKETKPDKDALKNQPIFEVDFDW